MASTASAIASRNVYYLAIDYGLEGWKLRECETLDQVGDLILRGETFGNRFKVFQELVPTEWGQKKG